MSIFKFKSSKRENILNTKSNDNCILEYFGVKFMIGNHK